MLHDIGKLGVADAVLKKSGMLTDDEWSRCAATRAGWRAGGVNRRRAGTVCQHTNKGWEAMRGFGLTIEPLAGDAVCVALRGELDLEHAYTFDEELRRVEGGRPSCLVLDLRGLSFLDSCGLARLLAARRRARREQRRLLLVRGGAAVQRLLAITAVSEHFETVSDVPPELRVAAAGVAREA